MELYMAIMLVHFTFILNKPEQCHAISIFSAEQMTDEVILLETDMNEKNTQQVVSGIWISDA